MPSVQVPGFEDTCLLTRHGRLVCDFCSSGPFSPGMAASYAISVRRASALPAASFRFHLAMDTLAVRLEQFNVDMRYIVFYN